MLFFMVPLYMADVDSNCKSQVIRLIPQNAANETVSVFTLTESNPADKAPVAEWTSFDPMPRMPTTSPGVVSFRG